MLKESFNPEGFLGFGGPMLLRLLVLIFLIQSNSALPQDKGYEISYERLSSELTENEKKFVSSEVERTIALFCKAAYESKTCPFKVDVVLYPHPKNCEFEIDYILASGGSVWDGKSVREIKVDPVNVAGMLPCLAATTIHQKNGQEVAIRRALFCGTKELGLYDDIYQSLLVALEETPLFNGDDAMSRMWHFIHTCLSL